MTIESPQDPSRTPGEEPGLPRGDWPSFNALLAMLGLVLLIVVAFIQFA